MATTKSVPAVTRSGLATGDTIYRNSGGGWSRLAIGATDTLLSVASGLPAWHSLATVLANVFGTTNGKWPMCQAGAWSAFASGASGTVLTGQGTTSVPTWVSNKRVYSQTGQVVGTANFAPLSGCPFSTARAIITFGWDVTNSIIMMGFGTGNIQAVWSTINAVAPGVTVNNCFGNATKNVWAFTSMSNYTGNWTRTGSNGDTWDYLAIAFEA